ncbi:MAG TPA: protein kinase [Verrucomicrobiales bacterium]|nr:protein kinase [Verrucomicrobiales bacterium]
MKLKNVSAAKKKTKPASPGPELPLEGDLPEHLRRLWKRHLRDDYELLGIVGKGKNGIVYKIAHCATGIVYCLKTTRPDLEQETAFSAAANLRKEIEILLPLSHRCIPKIAIFDAESDPPFYVCCFHPGKTFDLFQKSEERLNTEDSLFVVSSLVSVLEYLHSKGRTHCDIHPKNVMLDGDVMRNGILLIDFGSGHRESDTRTQTENRGLVFNKIAQDKAQQHKLIDRSDAISLGAYSDFRGLGQLLATMANVFFADGSIAQKAAYEDFHCDLDGRNIITWKNAKERLLEIYDPLRKLTMLDRIFLDERGRRTSIQLPVSGAIFSGAIPNAIINTQAFQNLRQLAQLSFCDWIYPGACHTRFEHSLGVFDLVRKALSKLSLHSRFRESYSFDKLKGCLLAALLHDVGHYPLAHVVEQFAAGGRLNEDRTILKDISHSSHSKWMIEHDLELRETLERHWGEEATLSCSEILEGKHGVLSALIDGAIDCDKMDYLRRDALHCGLSCAKGLDVDYLLDNLRPSGDGAKIVVEESGVSSVEALMVLQHQMLSSVYWNPLVRGIICMMHVALAHITVKSPIVLRNLVADLKKSRSNLEAVKDVILPALRNATSAKGSKDDGERKSIFEDLRKLVDLHVHPQYKNIFRPVRTYSFWQSRKDREAKPIFGSICTHPSSFSSASIPPVDWENVNKLRKAYRQALKDKGIVAEKSEVIVDVPLGKSSHRAVTVLRNDGSECEITDISHLNSTIFESPAFFVSPVRVYVSPKVFENAKSKLTSIITSAEGYFHNPID